jgi:hypothetical protein
MPNDEHSVTLQQKEMDAQQVKKELLAVAGC